MIKLKKGARLSPAYILIIVLIIILSLSLVSSFSLSDWLKNLFGLNPQLSPGVCTDTDVNATYPDGKNYYLAGTANIDASNSIDRCLNPLDPSVHTLIEGYCVTPAGPTNSVAYECPNGCLNGACVASITQTTCTDSDGGYNLTRYGITSSKGPGTASTMYDDCVNSSRIKEFFCLANGTINSADVSCPSGTVCSSGACAPLVITCTDSDGGYNLTRYGITSRTNGSTSIANNDSCISSSNIREYFCSGLNINHTDIACPSGTVCSSGACATSTITCTDSDGGPIVETFGTVNNGSIIRNDTCFSLTVVNETFCSGKDILNVNLNCQAGQQCQNGACISVGCTPATSNICLNKQCGTFTNGTCGDISCGSCGSGYACNSTNQCVITSACTQTCSQLNYSCSSVCGHSCGICGTGTLCNSTSKKCIVNSTIATNRSTTTNTPQACKTNWQCTPWTPETCTSSKTQTRTCTDENQCNTLSQKPAETQSCEYKRSVIIIVLIIILILAVLTIVSYLLYKYFKNHRKSTNKDSGTTAESIRIVSN